MTDLHTDASRTPLSVTAPGWNSIDGPTLPVGAKYIIFASVTADASDGLLFYLWAGASKVDVLSTASGNVTPTLVGHVDGTNWTADRVVRLDVRQGNDEAVNFEGEFTVRFHALEVDDIILPE
jgi:hypothetical protein